MSSSDADYFSRGHPSIEETTNKPSKKTGKKLVPAKAMSATGAQRTAKAAAMVKMLPPKSNRLIVHSNNEETSSESDDNPAEDNGEVDELADDFFMIMFYTFLTAIYGMISSLTMSGGGGMMSSCPIWQVMEAGVSSE